MNWPAKYDSQIRRVSGLKRDINSECQCQGDRLLRQVNYTMAFLEKSTGRMTISL